MFQLPFVASDPRITVAYPDPIVDKGTIMHWDFTRSDLSTFADGSTFQDIAADSSSRLLQVEKANLSSVLSVPNNPTEFLTEKTLKGGLHVITTQNILSNVTSSGRMTNLPLSAPVRSYMDDNRTHKYYVSIIGILTRRPTTERPFFMFSATSYTANYNFYFRHNATASNSGPTTGATYSPSNFPNVGVPMLYTVEVIAKTGNWDINAVNARSGIFQGVFGNVSVGGLASFISYRATISDLTVSGKTATQKRAEDLAIFNELFKEGGRLNGDVWTPPTI
jgi:hypothetical protein